MTEIVFSPELSTFDEAISSLHYVVLCGANNAGKPLILKNIKHRRGKQAYMVGAQRFYHIYHIGTQVRNPNEYDSFENQFNSQFNNVQYNYEQNYIELGRILAGLNDTRRNQLFDLCGQLVGNKFSLKKIEEDNELSMRFVDMDGQNLSVGSTGVRLLMTMLGICMDTAFKTILIDEPELGLGPRIQTRLTDFFSDEKQCHLQFPHLKQIIVATHSHLFLDRKTITNNYVVRKNGEKIFIEQIDNFVKFHTLQFNLLGNSLESLFLPSAFVLVEGKTDEAYLARWIQRELPEKKILMMQGNAKSKLHSLREALGDLSKTPFRSRIFVVLDARHGPGDREELTKMGLLPENLIVWTGNGIEYVYPPSIMRRIFNCSEEQLNELNIDDDLIELNGVRKKKSELCEETVSMISGDTEMPTELATKFITPLRSAVS